MKKKNIYLKKKRYLNKFLGNSFRPRLSIFRSNKYIYAQIIDDKNHQILVSASSCEKCIKFFIKKSFNKKVAFFVGNILAKRAIKKNIFHIIYKKEKYSYQGKIQALIEGIKINGLII
jgi:large subunit ribosomal protein L18